MQTVLQILLQLNANTTAFIQFFIFVISITFLTVYVYAPFFKANDARIKLTKGSEQVAQETEDEAKKIESIFQLKAREINEKIKNIFEIDKKVATDSATNLLSSAKVIASEQIENSRKDIEKQKLNAQSEIKKISEEISNEITKKITGSV